LGMTATQVRGLDELRNALAEFDALRPPADNRNPR
jgi:putative hydrolase of the HAD superfamily